MTRRTIGILIFPEVEVLDFCGPFEVFSATRLVGIYDAPEPWGPWTSAYFVEDWDVGPGETCGLPTKWMSADGRAVHLVFSGDDCFSIRAADLIVDEPGGPVRAASR